MIDRKALTIFIVIAFLIAWPLFLLPLAFKNNSWVIADIFTDY